MAEWSTAYINDLPDSAFACPEQRKYPHHDASGKLDLPHLRAALSRVGDPDNEQCGKAHLQAHARAEGIADSKAGDVVAKSLMPVLAKAQTSDEAEAWLAGQTPRRMLAIPFGGPIPSPKSPRGVDLDGQWFSERTDLVGDYVALKATRDRLVDWHHSYAPIGGRGGDPAPTRVNMNGVAVGKAVLDEQPDDEGLWADFWLDAGQRRLSLVRRLVEKGAQLFASAQPVAPGKADPATGEITYYPLLYMTVTTSPQNTLAVVTPKALLAELDSAELSVSPAMRGLLAELDALGAELPQSFRSGGDAAVKAGGVLSGLTALENALGTWESMRDDLRAGQHPERESNHA